MTAEHAEQAALFEWASIMQQQYPELWMLAAIPNGGFRHIVTAVKLKREGVKQGYPDVLLDVARGGYHGLRIEMKRQKGGILSPHQKRWRESLTDQGYQVAVCHGAGEAIDAVEKYLNSGAEKQEATHGAK